MNIVRLIALPKALQRRLIRRVAESLGLGLELKHVREILRVVQGKITWTELPRHWSASVGANQLRFHQEPASDPAGYAYPLPVPGLVDIPETRSRFEAAAVSNPGEGLDASRLTNPLCVRNWRPGDRFWPAHSRSPKKVKELLQERKITGTERKLWPVVASGDDIVWLRGFPAPASFAATQPGRPALLIRETSSQVPGLA